jgi:hypothetical protein
MAHKTINFWQLGSFTKTNLILQAVEITAPGADIT